ncbi:hypothetical protein SAMN05216499_1342 [Actinacidiphila paucisporea]|uniref:Uncharacterized protein n=1 Tax=Actinacidiphila paucisporea TaxID=310782 RepID=A0A1M7QG75_9ACTN|nr:hypothetical protein SAMN05216499_1342 [Actinacidiphila paucisporea]
MGTEDGRAACGRPARPDEQPATPPKAAAVATHTASKRVLMLYSPTLGPSLVDHIASCGRPLRKGTVIAPGSDHRVTSDQATAGGGSRTPRLTPSSASSRLASRIGAARRATQRHGGKRWRAADRTGDGPTDARTRTGGWRPAAGGGAVETVVAQLAPPRHWGRQAVGAERRRCRSAAGGRRQGGQLDRRTGEARRGGRRCLPARRTSRYDGSRRRAAAGHRRAHQSPDCGHGRGRCPVVGPAPHHVPRALRRRRRPCHRRRNTAVSVSRLVGGTRRGSGVQALPPSG